MGRKNTTVLEKKTRPSIGVEMYIRRVDCRSSGFLHTEVAVTRVSSPVSRASQGIVCRRPAPRALSSAARTAPNPSDHAAARIDEMQLAVQQESTQFTVQQRIAGDY